MRAAMGSIELLSTGRYRVSLELPRGDDGRRRRLSRTVRGTRGDAEAELARMKLDQGKPVEARGMTVGDYWRVFYEPSLSNLAPHTESSYRSAWKLYVEPMFAHRELASLKARVIENELMTIAKPGARRNAFKLLRQVVTDAYRNEMCDGNPFDRKIRIGRADRKPQTVLSIADLPEWLEAVRGEPFEAAVLLMLFCGLRREEAMALSWGDISFGENRASVRIERALVEVSGKVIEGPTKTPESRRTVFVSGPAMERLRQIASSGPICRRPDGARMAPDKASKSYRAKVERAGAKYVPMMNLRTSYATIMQSLGSADSVISRSLGHTDIKTDYGHYFAANEGTYVEAAGRLAEAVSGAFRSEMLHGNGAVKEEGQTV